MYDINVLEPDGILDQVDGAVPAPSTSVSTSFCKISNLKKSFSGAGPVLKGINLDLYTDQAVALVGSNGAGKSTLLRTLVRLIEPDAGSVKLFDEEVTQLGARPLRRLRSRVGFVFQKHNLVSRMDVLSNVIHGAQARLSGPRVWYQGIATAQVREEALQCLDRVGLVDLASRRADQLSGGQSQRVAIARTLMQRPEIVFADEPVASLDPKAGTEIMSMFANIMHEEGVTLIFSTHSLDHSIDYSDRVIGMKAGQVILDTKTVHTSQIDIQKIYGNT